MTRGYQKLQIPVVHKKIFHIEKVEQVNYTPYSFSPNRKNEGSHCGFNDQARKLLGSKRKLFETSNVAQFDNNPCKRLKSNDVDEAIDSSSFKCLETLVKIILSSERKQTHEEEQISILTELGHNLLSQDHSMLLQHSSLLSHLGFLAQQEQVSKELILRDLKFKYGM